MSLFELGLSSERKASHDCIGIEMKIQDNIRALITKITRIQVYTTF